MTATITRICDGCHASKLANATQFRVIYGGAAENGGWRMYARLCRDCEAAGVTLPPMVIAEGYRAGAEPRDGGD